MLQSISLSASGGSLKKKSTIRKHEIDGFSNMPAHTLEDESDRLQKCYFHTHAWLLDHIVMILNMDQGIMGYVSPCRLPFHYIFSVIEEPVYSDSSISSSRLTSERKTFASRPSAALSRPLF